MAQDKPSLKQQYRLLALSPEVSKFIDIVNHWAKEANDVSVDIGMGENDSIDVRRAIGQFLQSRLDRITRTRKNEVSNQPGSSNDLNETDYT
jgi:hypothetical protein